MTKITLSQRGGLLALLCVVLLSGCATSQGLKGTKEEGLRLARLLRDQGRLEAASEVYARLDSRGKLDGGELLEYASVAAPVRPPLQVLGLYGRARQQLGASTPPQTLAICVGMGRAQLALGRGQMAQQDFRCALDVAPNNASALNGMGVVMDAAGRHDEARALFDKALRSDPADVAALNNLALSWLNSGQADKAVSLLRSSELRHPSVKLNLALAYLYAGRDEDARGAIASVAVPERIDGLVAELSRRAADLRQSRGQGEALLLASRQPLSLGEEKP
ncbi:tetratricopeptide repeat protein [Lonsdalea britannica]|uniref:tetratricopeptide repeat protein n=1 Tax=Lonsdalea britannica TaxID=1082704 RepID=UPI0026EB100F|nr:tetratricopeptide repeat protein [Lonsdalea britannica]